MQKIRKIFSVFFSVYAAVFVTMGALCIANNAYAQNVDSVESGGGKSTASALVSKTKSAITYRAAVFTVAGNKLVDTFRNTKAIIYVIGGFGLVGFAFLAIFGKVKWAWLASLAFGLAILAAASGIITYAANGSTEIFAGNTTAVTGGGPLGDTLTDEMGSGSGM